MTTEHPDPETPQRIELRIRGQLGEAGLLAFDDLRAESDGENTVLTGVVVDQAAVHGVLARIESLGLKLLEFRLLPPVGRPER